MYIPKTCGECISWNPRTQICSYKRVFRRQEEPLCVEMKTSIVRCLEIEKAYNALYKDRAFIIKYLKKFGGSYEIYDSRFL